MALTPEEIRRINQEINEDEEVDITEEAHLFMTGELVEGEAPIAIERKRKRKSAPDFKVERSVRKFETTESGSVPISKTDALVDDIHDEGIVHVVTYDHEVQAKILHSAENTIMNNLKEKEHKQTKRVQDAKFDSVADAAQNFGIDTGRPMWQLRLAELGSGFWFIIWYIISFFTFTPIIFFLKMIGVQVQHARLKWVFTLILYVVVMFLLVMLVSKLAGWTWWVPSPEGGNA